MCDAHDDQPPATETVAPSAGATSRAWSRRRFFGAMFAGASVAAVGLSPLGRGLVQAADRTPVALDGPGAALQTADRLSLVSPVTTTAPDGSAVPTAVPDGKLAFPLDPASDCYVLDNFGDARGSRLHEGIDIMGSRDQPVFAVASGILVQRYTNTGTAGWGWTLYDPDAERQYKFFHLSEDPNGLEEGDRVEAGDTIGFVGNSGTYGVDNYHLHFEVRLGERWPTEPIDPLPLLHVDTEVCGISDPMRA